MANEHSRSFCSSGNLMLFRLLVLRDQKIQHQSLCGKSILLFLCNCQSTAVKPIKHGIQTLDGIDAGAGRCYRILTERELIKQEWLVPIDAAEHMQKLKSFDQVNRPNG